MPRIMKTPEEKKTSAIQASLRWRAKNKEAYNLTQKPHSLRYYRENKEVENKKALQRYHYRKEAIRFRNILLE